MPSFEKALNVYSSPKMLVMLILGFFSGLPLVLVFSTLAYWLQSYGVSKTDIGFFSLVRLPYSFKFLWSPYIDRYSIPILKNKLGQRRSWALLFQVCLMISLFCLVGTNPSQTPLLTGVFAVMVAFFSASQDIVLDAFRIEDFKPEDQGAASATFVFGYRLGMLMAGAGALYMSDIMSWQSVYQILALSFLLGVITILCVKEPARRKEISDKGDFFQTSVIAPLQDLLTRKSWVWIMALLLTYKLCETTFGTMIGPFYIEMGFTGTEIATITKLYGLIATIVGGLLGGVFVIKFGLINSLILGGILQGLSNLPFAYLALHGKDLFGLATCVVFDNLASGIATSAFVAYMSFLCNTSYTATQYALLSSLMALPRDVLSSFSGMIADRLSWVEFFIFTAVCSLPSLAILLVLKWKIPIPSSETQ